ncbi:MAG: hypothetical protein CL674_05685 [Bdellovibrionaceae bacterium]|nr:hypothetical protein [Pseudobdellovibrionaceae bacterium]
MFLNVAVVLVIFSFGPLVFAGNASCIDSASLDASMKMGIGKILEAKNYSNENSPDLVRSNHIRTSLSEFERVQYQLEKRLGSSDLVDTYNYFKSTDRSGKAIAMNWINWLERAPEFVKDRRSLELWIKIGKKYKDPNLTKYIFDLLAEKFALGLEYRLAMLDELVKKIESEELNPLLEIEALLTGRESREDFYLEELEHLESLSSYVVNLSSFLEMRYLNRVEKKGFERQLAKWNLLKITSEQDFQFMESYKNAIEYQLLIHTQFNIESISYLFSSKLVDRVLNSELSFQEAYKLLERFRRLDEDI